MTVYYIRGGELVEASSLREARQDNRSIFPSPMISRMEPYESPITGKDVTSWGERERELKANNAYDPRDVTKPYKRGRAVQLKEKEPHVRPEQLDLFPDIATVKPGPDY